MLMVEDFTIWMKGMSEDTSQPVMLAVHGIRHGPFTGAS